MRIPFRYRRAGQRMKRTARVFGRRLVFGTFGERIETDRERCLESARQILPPT